MNVNFLLPSTAGCFFVTKLDEEKWGVSYARVPRAQPVGGAKHSSGDAPQPWPAKIREHHYRNCFFLTICLEKVISFASVY